MERNVLLGILAVQEGWISAADMLVFLAGIRSSGQDLGRSLERSGRVNSQQWTRLETLADQQVHQHGSVQMALEAAAKKAMTQLDRTLSVEAPVGRAAVADIPAELSAEMGPVSLEHPGRYKELRDLGRGAIGRVAAAQDSHLGREVAIKELLPPERTGPKANAAHRAMQVVRFLREARVTAILEHPSIVPVYELGVRPDGSLYYSMKHVKGKTLHQAILESRGVTGRRALLDRYINLCQAIAYAHSRNVIHRDIKPKNVMLGEFGETILLDWGLAKVLGTQDDPGDYEPLDMGGLSSQETQAGFTVGTPAYMSPEQAANQRGLVDARTDVWALGIVLYEILTGTVPFKGEWAGDVLSQVLSKEITPPHLIDFSVDRDLSAVCMKCLERDVGKRYQSAKELASDVQAYLSGGRVSAYRYSRMEVLRKFARHKPGLAAMTLALAVALLGGATWITLLFLNSEYHRILAVAEGQEKAIALEQVQEEKARVEAARLASDRSNREAHLNLSIALAEEARRRMTELDFLGSDIFAASALLHTPHNRLSPYTYPDEFTQQQKADAMAQMADLRSLLYFGEVNRRQTLDWSVYFAEALPAGAVALASGDFAVLLENGALFLVDGITHQTKLKHRFADSVVRASFSRDGKWGLFQGSRMGTVLFPLSAPEKTKALEAFPDGSTFQSVFSRDASSILVSQALGGVRWMSLDGKTPPLDLPIEAALGPKRALALSDDGQWAAAGTEQGDLCLVRIHPMAKPICTLAHVGNTLGVEFLPDSKSLVSAGFDGNVVLRDVNTFEVKWKNHVYDGHLTRMGLDGAKGRIYVASHDGWVMQLDASDGHLVERFRAHAGGVRGVALVGNERLLTLGDDGRLLGWKLFEPRATQITGTAGAAINHIAISPDDSKLAAIDTLYRVCLWDLNRPGQPVCHKPGQTWDVVFSPDGKWLALGLARNGVALWSVADGQMRLWDAFDEAKTVAVAFTPDSKKLIVDSCYHMRLYDVAGAFASEHPAPERDFAVTQGPRVWDLDAFPDGRRVVTASDATLRVVSLADGRVLKEIGLSDRDLSSVSVSPDGRLIAASGKSGLAWLVDAESGRVVREFRGHENWVNTTCLSRDGQYVLTASDDKSFRLWNAATGEPMIVGPTLGEVLGVAFSSDSRRFFVGLGNAVAIFPIVSDPVLEEPARLLELAQERQGMVLKGFELAVLGH